MRTLAMPDLMRLDAVLSRFGYCTRSEAVHWLNRGRVQVAGQVARKPSDKADPASVTIDGQSVDFPQGMLLMMHKPVGLVCSHDPREGPSIYGLLPERWMRRNPAPASVGRLDKDTSGLLLITDLGQLIHQLTNPKHDIQKVYQATLDQPPPQDTAERFASGEFVLPDEPGKPCKPAQLEMITPTQVQLTLTEGRYHQVRRMFAAVGCTVLTLHRSRFGPWELPADLAPGQWRAIEQAKQ